MTSDPPKPGRPVAAALAGAHGDPAAPGAGPSPTGERIGWVKGTAGRLRVSDGGEGEPAVVLLHGLGSDLEVWRAQLDHLRASHRVVAYDQRGHGASDKARDSVYTVEALAADLEAVHTALGLGRVVLVGHSLSGTVLTTYAGAHPDAVVGLVYVDAVGDFHAVPPGQFEKALAGEASPAFGAAQRRAAYEEMLDGARPGTRAQVLAALDRMDPPAFASLRRSMFGLRDARERLAAFRGPAAAIEGGDQPYPTGAAAVLGLPRTAVADASHWLQLDQPDAVNRALDAFLVQLPRYGR